jgi:hypothetical protein
MGGYSDAVVLRHPEPGAADVRQMSYSYVHLLFVIKLNL